jgi:hypothetical protein
VAVYDMYKMKVWHGQNSSRAISSRLKESGIYKWRAVLRKETRTRADAVTEIAFCKVCEI